MISIYSESEFVGQVDFSSVFIALGIFFAITLAFYLLRSFGLYALAKRQEIKCAWIAFIPFAWFYVACKLVGESRFFNKPIAKLAIFFTIIVGLNAFLTFAIEVVAYYPIVGNLLAGNGDWAIGACPEGYYNYDLLVSGIYHKGQFANPYGTSLIAIGKVLVTLDTINAILSLISIIFQITVFMWLFRKYIPQHYLLFMLLSVMAGIFAPLVFAIRKRQPINYLDYVRSRYYSRGGYGNPYGNQYNNNPYNNPYNNGNQYNNPYGAQSQPKQPFDEFGEKGERDADEPFSEFDDKDKN